LVSNGCNAKATTDSEKLDTAEGKSPLLSVKTINGKLQLGLEHYIVQLECGPMPNLMVALPNIGGALCSTPQSLADAHY